MSQALFLDEPDNDSAGFRKIITLRPEVSKKFKGLKLLVTVTVNLFCHLANPGEDT